VLARQGRQQLLEEAPGEVLVEEVEVVLAAVCPEVLGAILWQGVDLAALLLLILPVGPADRAGLVVGFLQKGRHLNPMDPVAVGVLSLLEFWGDFALAGFLGLLPLAGTVEGVVAAAGRTWATASVLGII
jgi:hypothetical protein